MLEPSCGMMKTAMLCCKNFVKDTKEVSYVLNPYETYVENEVIENKQHTLTWHVDDAKASHKSPTFNDDLEKWCENKYGSDTLGHVKVIRGKIHGYFGTTLDCRCT